MNDHDTKTERFILPKTINSFDEWLSWIFDRPITDPEWYWEIEVKEPDIKVDPTVHVGYLTKLFVEGGSLLERFSDAQVGQGLTYIFDVGISDTTRLFYDSSVLHSDRVRAIHALSSLYTDVFAKRCVSELWKNVPKDSLHVIHFMLWELCVLHGHHDQPDYEKLDQACLDVLTKIIAIPHIGCIQSGLHGIAIFSSHFPDKVKTIIDNWLASPLAKTMPPELIKYARGALVRWRPSSCSG